MDNDFKVTNTDSKPFVEISHEINEELNYKSKLVVGNITVRFTKKFNWFNRLMIRLVFGLKIEKEVDWWRF